MSLLSDAQLIETVERASARSAAMVHQKMKRGLDSLASIVSTAAFVGMFGTLLGILNSFKGLGTEKSTILTWAYARSFSESLVPAAMGLFVATTALAFYKYLIGDLEALDIEMENASPDMISHLMIYLRRRNQSES